ncbi:MAG TPA: MarR family winged helix-turn-helix transcriptional regulator [Flavobacterium sp.]|jgi:DNA-binding MarR family transcriptional regulator
MSYRLIQDVVELAEIFEAQNITGRYSGDASGFKQWCSDQSERSSDTVYEVNWDGKENGRSAESVINTMLVHLNRYARTYAKAAIYDSEFSTPEEFIYLINLDVMGAMSKTRLIRKNVQEKSSGIQIINRLIRQGWVSQSSSDDDKRSRMIEITESGKQYLDQYMDKIRTASKIVTGDLDQNEKMTLIQLLTKLDSYHRPIFNKEIPGPKLLETVKTMQE